MWFSSPGEWAPEVVGDVALAVIRWEKESPRWQHAIILYRDTGGALQLLHLAGHRELERFPFPIAWVEKYALVKPGLDELRGQWLAAHFDAIWAANEEGRIPYAFEYFGGTLDAETRAYVPHESAPHGLSCSTFILCAHATAGIKLIDVESWPGGRNGDDAELFAIVEAIKAHSSVDMDHLEALRTEVGNKVARFRPQEVVASYSGAFGEPLGFAIVEPLGWELLQCLMKGELARLFFDSFSLLGSASRLGP